MERSTKLRETGKCVVIADTYYTIILGLDPARFRGDLAFHCLYDDSLYELKRLGYTNDRGIPRSAANLWENDFADVVVSLAAQFHLDQSTHTASVGTEERAEKADQAAVEFIEGKVFALNEPDE